MACYHQRESEAGVNDAGPATALNLEATTAPCRKLQLAPPRSEGPVSCVGKHFTPQCAASRRSHRLLHLPLLDLHFLCPHLLRLQFLHPPHLFHDHALHLDLLRCHHHVPHV